MQTSDYNIASMNVVVAIKRMPTPEQRISIGADGKIDETGLSYAINPNRE